MEKAPSLSNNNLQWNKEFQSINEVLSLLEITFIKLHTWNACWIYQSQTFDKAAKSGRNLDVLRQIQTSVATAREMIAH